MGWLYSWLGQFERARELLDDALRLSRESGDRSAEARALSRLGAVQRRLGQLAEARDSLLRSLALQQELSSRFGEAVAVKELARTYFELGEYTAARRAFERALDGFRKLRKRKVEAEVLSDLGWLHDALDDPQRALAYFAEAVEIFQRAGNRSGEASALYGAARTERTAGKLGAARERIENALAIVESLRTQTEIMELRSSYLAGKQDYYELYIDLLMESHDGDPTAGFDALALETSERRRARTLLDLLSEDVENPDQDPHPAPPRVGLAEIRQLLDHDTLLLEYTLGKKRSFLWMVTPTQLQHFELPGRSEIGERARDAHRLLASRGRRGKGRLRLVTTRLSELLLAPVAEALGTKRLLVVSDEALQYIPLAALPIPPGHPAESGRARGGPAPPMVTEHEIVHLPSLAVLALLRRQIEARRPAPRLVAVVADPVFDARDPRVEKPAPETIKPSDPGDPDLPPFDDRRSDAGRKPAPELRLGPREMDEKPWLGRLTSSRQEAEAILALVPAGEGLAALDFDASRELVMSGVLADYRYLHFATHGRFDPRRPEFLGLVLSQVDERGRPCDGSVGPHEIFHLNLPVAMVTLSTCRSGLGREVRGEGLVGLTQAFLHAGAARVMVSLWRVDDQATAELMARFYRGIFEDALRPAAALRSAQLSMLREKRWEAPYYWAGFFLQGEWR